MNTSRMNSFSRLVAIGILLGAGVSFPACSTSGVQDARASGVERRQDRMDSRTYARQERWRERGEREDARAAARFDSW
jgi:hypothetical protein